MSVVTRFPPSPTGDLHLGGARTALFNWLYARGRKGRMILRIEDTDRERSNQASVDAIVDGMRWLGLDYDEGPIFQTARFDRYAQVIDEMLDDGRAYRCYCSREEVDAMRESQRERGEKPRYDGRCRDRQAPEPGIDPVVRFRNPDGGAVQWDDLVKGAMSISNDELDDLVIRRSDGTPTYHLTVVVDDMDMQISHVVRGDDHVNNTPRQINILKALGATVPVYAHVPMILGADGARLSKRHGAVSVMSYREMGILPSAMRNYLIRLGWSHQDQEIFSTQEMLDLFKLEDIQKAAARFDSDKLTWVNHQYIMASDPADLESELRWHLDRRGVNTTGGPPLEAVIAPLQERSRTLVEMADRCSYFYQPPVDYVEKDARKHFAGDAGVILQAARQAFSDVPEWQGEALHQIVRDLAAAHEVGMGKVAQPIRVAVSGSAATPGIDITLQLIGRAEVLSRLDKAINWIQSRTAQ